MAHRTTLKERNTYAATALESFENGQKRFESGRFYAAHRLFRTCAEYARLADDESLLVRALIRKASCSTQVRSLELAQIEFDDALRVAGVPILVQAFIWALKAQTAILSRAYDSALVFAERSRSLLAETPTPSPAWLLPQWTPRLLRGVEAKSLLADGQYSLARERCLELAAEAKEQGDRQGVSAQTFTAALATLLESDQAANWDELQCAADAHFLAAIDALDDRTNRNMRYVEYCIGRIFVRLLRVKRSAPGFSALNEELRQVLDAADVELKSIVESDDVESPQRFEAIVTRLRIAQRRAAAQTEAELKESLCESLKANPTMSDLSDADWAIRLRWDRPFVRLRDDDPDPALSLTPRTEAISTPRHLLSETLSRVAERSRRVVVHIAWVAALVGTVMFSPGMSEAHSDSDRAVDAESSTSQPNASAESSSDHRVTVEFDIGMGCTLRLWLTDQPDSPGLVPRVDTELSCEPAAD